MGDINKTKEQLINELTGLRQRVAELEASEAEHKQAEEALRESEEKYKTLVEDAPIGIYFSDFGGTFLYGNKKAEEIVGYKRQELLGKSFLKVRLLDPKGIGKSIKLLALNKLGNATGPDEFVLNRKDGSKSIVEICTRITTVGGRKVVLGMVEDITERKLAEEREKELHQELYLTSRLAAVGELAAGVAHEINNPLTGVLGFSERLLRKSTDETVKQGLETIHHEAQRAARVVQNLLTFARRRGPAKEHSDISDILQRALELRGYELQTSNIEVVIDLAPSLPGVMVDPHQIQEVFLNIILNAEQVMTEANGGGKLTIKTRQMKDCVRTSFIDDGPGIPAEDFDKVFAPFFTTRRERSGTGLGLSVCHGIVTEHGGRIYAKSKAGKGATFFVELPCR